MNEILWYFSYTIYVFQVTYQDCLEIVTACKDNGCILAVAHVLRYSPQAMKIKELIDSGVIGDVANIQLLEPVCATRIICLVSHKHVH